MLLARLGLRAGEVAALKLDDIRWDTGNIVVCGKARERKRFPLLQDIGEAIAAYLRCGRPPSSSRNVFLRVKAPCRELADSATPGEPCSSLRNLRWNGRGNPATSHVHAALGISAWIDAQRILPDDWLFPNRAGKRLSTDGVQCILSKHVAIARRTCPSMEEKRVSSHVLRHTTAMNLLHSRTDIAVIALWLGHERMETTQIYVTAELKKDQVDSFHFHPA